MLVYSFLFFISWSVKVSLSLVSIKLRIKHPTIIRRDKKHKITINKSGNTEIKSKKRN